MRVFIACIIVSTWLVLAETKFEHTNYYVKLGDPWGVNCNTPYKEPPSWFFLSADQKYNYYIYTDRRLVDSVIQRYNVTYSNDGKTSILDVSQTDKDHAGFYACWPDPSNLVARQFFKLIITEYSTMKILLNENKSITLKIGISFLGFESPIPVFQCKFSYGSLIMDERICEISNKTFSICKLEKLFEPDDIVPTKCEILFNLKKWKSEELSLSPEPKVEFVWKGTSWNMNCDSASSYPMKWIFNSVKSINQSIDLSSKWIPNKQYKDRYDFSVSNDRRLYNMKIPRVDLDHAGTYMCTHKSSDHLVDRKIHLLVIDYSSIQLATNFFENINLMIDFTYMGNNAVTPLFSCTFQNETEIMVNMQCKVTGSGLSKCQLIETYNNIDYAPKKCQIMYENNLLVEKEFTKSNNSVDAFFYVLTLVLVITIIMTAGVIFMCRRRICKVKQIDQTRDNQCLLPKSGDSVATYLGQLSMPKKPTNVDSYHVNMNENIVTPKKWGSVDDLCIKYSIRYYNYFQDNEKTFNEEPGKTTKGLTDINDVFKNATKNIEIENGHLNLKDRNNMDILNTHKKDGNEKQNNVTLLNSPSLYKTTNHKYQDFDDNEMDLVIKLNINNKLDFKLLHRKVISECSPFIKNKLEQMTYKNNLHLDLSNLNGEGVLTIIDWAYTKCLHLTEHNVQCVLETASYLKVNDIVKQCIDHICTNLTYKKCAITYVTCMQFSDFDFHKKVRDYIVLNFFSLMYNDHLDGLPLMDVVNFAADDNMIILFNNVKQLNVSDQEFKLLEIVGNYLKRKREYGFWPEFLTKSIRLGFLSNEQLASLIKDQSWLGNCKDLYTCQHLLNRLMNEKQNKENDYQYRIWSIPRNTSNGFKYFWSKIKVNTGYYDLMNRTLDGLDKELWLSNNATALVIVKSLTLWYSTEASQNSIEGIEVIYNSNNSYKHGSTSTYKLRTYTDIVLRENEFINQVDYKYSKFINSLTFRTNLGHIFGPYGGEGGMEGQSKPLKPGGFLAGIRTIEYGRQEPDIISSMEFCWGYFNNEKDSSSPS